MQEYIEVFRVEAKSLLKNFRENNSDAVARCKAVFGDKADLSLMNMQHVIAKEYGFNDWNDLQKAESWQLAEALIKAKNKSFVSPLKLWHGGKIVTGYEKGEYKLHKPEDYGIDMKNFVNAQGYPELTFEHLDVSEYDLSKLDVLNVRYANDTKWPDDMSRMPKGFKPKEFLEYRKNPGLGIRQLHKQGIDGKGRNVAIIDFYQLFDHLEYHDQLKGYEEIHIDPEDYAGGRFGAFVSSLVGKTCGVAPKAEVYYYAVDTANRTQVYYAEAIRRVCELHKKLISEGKSGIDVILILRGISFEGFSDDDGYVEAILAAQEATKLGIWCRIGSPRFKENGMWREERVYCKFGGDVDNPDDFVLDEHSVLNRTPLKQEGLFRNSLCFPGGCWTVALDVKMNEYVFGAKNGPFFVAYEVGLYLLAKSIKPDLTPTEYFRLGLETGDFREGIGTIVNPQRLINELRK